MKNVKKVCFVCLLTLLVACLFVFVGCDAIKEAAQNAGYGDAYVKIEGASDFSIPSKLKEKKTYSSAQEVADLIEDVSEGTVTASMIVDKIVATECARYRIQVTIPSEAEARGYLEEAGETYFATFKGWKNFPSSPAVYTTKDGKDVLVFLNHVSGTKDEIDLYVLFFEADSVDALASAVSGGGNGGGGSYNGGGNGGQSGKDYEEGETNTIQVEGAYDFTAMCKLQNTTTFSDGGEIADMIEDFSDGMVTADSVVSDVVASKSVVYSILLTAPGSVSKRDYCDFVVDRYHAQFGNDWKYFPNSPVRYKTQNDIDVLVFFGDESDDHSQIDLVVLTFRAGTVDALASAVSGGNGGGGSYNGGGNGGQSGKDYEEGETNTIRVELAYDFTAMCKLTKTTSFSDGAKIAAMIEDFSEGMVTADSVVSDVVASKSVVYSILLTAPGSVSKRDYCDFVVDRYHAQFGNDWKYFPNSPVRYKTQNDIDVLVFFGDESDDHSQIDLVVLTFRAGAVDALASAVSGGGNGGGGSYNGGGSSFNDGGNDGGNGGGNGGENGGGNGGNGGNGLNEDPPYEVRYTIYDLNAKGEKSLYMSDLKKYGEEISFDWCKYVVFEDPKFEKMIAPDQKIKMEKDLVVYRRDFYDKVPVFINVHFIINGLEYRVDHRIFYRGEILNKEKLGESKYEYYRGAKGEKMFESGVEVIREEDDKTDVYAYCEDPLFHKATFKIGTKEIGTLLVYEGSTYFGRNSAMDLGGQTTYEILDDPIDVKVSDTGDFTVNIKEYIEYSGVPITVHCCYNGDIKYTYVNYEGLGEDNRIEISKNREYYTTADCTTLFEGYVTGASTFYSRIEVDLTAE